MTFRIYGETGARAVQQGDVTAMSNSDVLRKHWWALSPTAHDIFKVLYKTQDYVPYEELMKHLYNDDLEKVFGWIGRSIREAGGGTVSWNNFIDWGDGGYRLRDHLRPVVGEKLGHHEKEKTVLLETIWTMKEMFDLLERRVDDIPGDKNDSLYMEFKSCQQELDRLSQELLNPANA